MRGIRRSVCVSDRFVYSLLGGDGGEHGVRFGSLRVLLNYLVPSSDKKLDRGYVDLRPMTAIGFMGMGKTVFFTQITRLMKTRVRRRFGEEVLAITGKSIVDVVEYVSDNHDVIQGRRAIVLFLDDILYQGLSTEKSKAKDLAEKYYSDIRHKPEELGFTNGVLYTFFAGQRWRLIPPFFRNSPIVVFKPLLVIDRYEKDCLLDILDYRKDDFSKAYSSLMLSILETTAKIFYQTWDDRVKSITVIRPAWDWPFIYIQTDVPNPGKVFDIFVPYNYSGVYDETDIRKAIDNLVAIQYYIAGVLTGLKIRDHGVYTLSVSDIRKLVRNVLGIGFNNNKLNTDTINKSLKLINDKSLNKFIEEKLGKPLT